MSDILKLQHIATKNALLGEIKGRYDYDEKVNVGQIIGLLEAVLIDKTRSKDAAAELDRQQQVLEAARGALLAVRADRPSAHSDKVWKMINAALAELEEE